MKSHWPPNLKAERKSNRSLLVRDIHHRVKHLQKRDMGKETTTNFSTYDQVVHQNCVSDHGKQIEQRLDDELGDSVIATGGIPIPQLDLERRPISVQRKRTTRKIPNRIVILLDHRGFANHFPICMHSRKAINFSHDIHLWQTRQKKRGRRRRRGEKTRRILQYPFAEMIVSFKFHGPNVSGSVKGADASCPPEEGGIGVTTG